MKTQYILIIFGSFIIVSISFIYTMIIGSWFDFFTQLKWFMRVITPFFIIYIFYLGMNDKKN